MAPAAGRRFDGSWFHFFLAATRALGRLCRLEWSPNRALCGMGVTWQCGDCVRLRRRVVGSGAWECADAFACATPAPSIPSLRAWQATCARTGFLSQTRMVCRRQQGGGYSIRSHRLFFFFFLWQSLPSLPYVAIRCKAAILNGSGRWSLQHSTHQPHPCLPRNQGAICDEEQVGDGIGRGDGQGSDQG